MDIRDLIQKADAYGKVSEKSQKELEEGLLDWFKDKLGLGDEEAKAAADAAEEAGADKNTTPNTQPPGTDPTGNTAGTPAPNTPPPGTGSGGSTNVPPRPTGSGRNVRGAQVSWDRQYGATNNPDGTPKTVGGTDPTGNTAGTPAPNTPPPGTDPTGNTAGTPADFAAAGDAQVGDAGPNNPPTGTDPTGNTADNTNTNQEPQQNQKDLMTRYNEGGKKAMPEIEKLQQDLQDLGFDPNGVDGKYGNGTFKAVQEFQKANGLQVDGQAGSNTLAKIEQVKSGGGAKPATDPNAKAGFDGPADAPAKPDADTQAVIDQLNKLLDQLGQPEIPAPSGGDPEVIATSADQDLISSMRGAIRIAESLIFEATQEQIDKLSELLAKLGDTKWAQSNQDAYQQYIDRTNRAMAAGSKPATNPNAKAGVDGPADATAAAVQGGDAAATSTPNASTAGGATDAEKAAGAGQAQPAAPKVGKEVYVQMGSNGPSTANFNVAQMKKKYPKPYVDIPAKDGTVTRGYGAPETLQAYVKKNPKAKIVGAGGGQPVVTSRQFDQDPILEAASMNVSADNAAELAELLGILRNAGMPDAMPVAHMHQPDPEPYTDSPCGGDDDDMDRIVKLSGQEPGDLRINDEEVEEGGWDNSPDEEYKDDDYMYQSGGIHRKKKAYKATQDGDNPMALENSIKAQLYQALEEKSKGLYYNVNKRKEAGTSRSKNHPDAPSEQDWKNAAKTAKKD